jgi:hypothetical protein
MDAAVGTLEAYNGVMATASSSAPRVELVVFEGCPNARAARELIDQVNASLALEPQVDVVVVPDAETAERARFLGSPTIRVDGRDIEPGAEDRTDYALACRVYETASGVAGLPEEAWLRQALKQ